MATFKVQLGKNTKNIFSNEFEPTDINSVRTVLKKYWDFYSQYRKSHVISARSWNFPIVYINDKPAYKVVPNGRLADLATDKLVF